MKLRSGRDTETINLDKQCGHMCELTTKKCCECMDKRDECRYYVAFNNSELSNISLVERNWYYCPTCKLLKSH